MLSKLETWHKAAAIIVAVMVIGWGAHAKYSEVTTQVSLNTKNIAIVTYDSLKRKLEAEGKLGPRDLAAYCIAANQIGVKPDVCGK